MPSFSLRRRRVPPRPPAVPRPPRALRTALALLVVAVAAPAAAAHAPGQCPVPVCRFAGTAWAEDLVGDELLIRGEARVVWTFSHMSGREAVYVASGRLAASWRTDRCAITLDPAEGDFSPQSPDARHTRLHVDFTVRPVRYRGTGGSGWAGTQTWRCPNGSTWTQEEGVTATWLVTDDAETSPDAGLLAGTYTDGVRRSSWEFRNSP